MTTFTPHCQTCRCGTVTLATQARTQRDTEIIDQWLEDNVQVNDPDSGRIYRRHLARAFEAWCVERAIEPPTSRALYARLRGRGHEEIKVRGLFYFRGLKVRGLIDLRALTVAATGPLDDGGATVDPSGAEAAPAST